MDSQEDSIDIAKLKRFALGLAENDTSQPLVNKPRISNSDNTQGRLQPARRDPGDDGQPAGQEPASHSLSEPAVLSANPAPQLPPPLEHNVNGTSLRKTSSQADPLRDAPEPVFGKMSSADGPGDTQPVSQSVFDSIIKRDMSFQALQEGNKIDVEMGYDEGTMRMTLHEGDPGHIDLLSGFGETEAGNENSDQDDDGSTSKVGESSPLQRQSNLFPESQRFLRTPAAVEKQHDTPKLATTTPSLPRNPLASDGGSSGGLMALSQVFKATQAPSSPFVNGLPSEPLSDRPSPDIPIQNRPLPTSLSSPSRAPGLRRGFTEPQANYISMKESQTRRERVIEERRARSAENLNSEDQSDSEFEKEPSFVQRLNRQRRIDEEANAQLVNVTAPARSNLQQSGRQPRPSRSPSGRDRRGKVHGSESAIVTTGHETQGSTLPFQSGGTSEEETEQEDDFVPPTSQSRPPLSSTEEDKENYNGPPIRIPETTARAHDRLSQALELQASPSLLRTPPADKITMSPQHAANKDHTSGFEELTTSSQVINVRDSQPSPSQRERQVLHAGNAAAKPWSQRNKAGQLRQSQQGAQAGLDPDVERVYSSPPAEALVTSSPPGKRQDLQRDLGQDNPQGSNMQRLQRRSTSVSSDDGVTNLTQGRSSQNDMLSHGKVNMSEKPSSMPSRVADTPVTKTTDTIPESSPTHFQQETSMGMTEPAMQEDDDLPPPRHQMRYTSDQDGKARSFRNAKILSSPSGKQRRALTEIAADASPQVGTGHYDIDFNILSQDDREFRSVVGFSPLPPKKRRRGNDGQNIIASDPAWPVTPRPESYRSDNRVAQSEAEPIDAQSIEQTFEPNVVRRQRPKPFRRAETVWEVELSPQNPAPKTATSQRPRVSRYSESRSTELRRPAKPAVMQQVVIHNERESMPASRGESPDPIQIDESSQDIPAGTGPQEPDSTEAPPVEAAQAREHSFEVQVPASEEMVRAPNQVFAFWNGRKRAYYPATCLRTIGGSSQQRYVVKFVDSGPVEVPVASVKRLQLRVGDGVKVEWPNVPRVTHVVRGFSGQLSVEELSKEDSYGLLPMTDVYGHSTVILAAKQRKSLPSGGLPEPERTIEVPISSIYLDMILWNQLKDRQFSFHSKLDQPSTRLQTPIRHHLTPISPASRLSRSILLAQTGLFAGMVFAVSFVEQEDAKSRVMKLIMENGGRILRDGFDELFEFPSSIPSATPSKSPVAANTTGDATQFRLTSSAESVGFACLVADKHSRRAKYMQALALNIPCLSGRWVEDCVRQNRILDWETYLLPAGESMYLHGAVKSRILTASPAHSARLAETIAGRPKLLEGQSVLLVMGRGKAEEKRKAYIFLTYALGASRVERVLDLKAAKAALQEHRQEGGQGPGWDWIYVDDHEEAAAKAMILGKSTGSAAGKLISRVGRKRKRSSTLVECIGGNDVDRLEKKVRIVGNEFVCQSLILGRLCEELS
ncbi:hypothetical protein VTN77DRAFT_2741 [Rasamsonia byssochlamydoides]|uniref:uncharacterized protein n=1 Tax=Rasamsonia byssochlamydoides TaxID=89139 RepID=UPI003744A99A